jgi:hypothetical protein
MSTATLATQMLAAQIIENELPSVILNTTFNHIIENYTFDNLSSETCNAIFKDGRPFSAFIEKWLEKNYPLIHVPGCKKYDHIDIKFPNILYDAKTFTKYGCSFCPSNMKGQGRKFDKLLFEEKSKKLIFCIVSNIDFPNIKVKFVKGEELIIKYPDGKIPLHEHVKFFN